MTMPKTQQGLFETILSSNPSGIIVCGPDGDFLHCNRAARELLQIEHGNFSSADFGSDLQNVIDRCITGNLPADRKVIEVTAATDPPRQLRISASPVTDAPDRRAAVLLFLEDVSESDLRREAQRRARQQEIVAELSRTAIGAELDDLFEEALQVAVAELDGDAAKLIEFDRKSASLVLRAGIGWEDDMSGQKLVDADAVTAIGHALRTGELVVVENFPESEFERTELVASHDIQSAMAVQIPGEVAPFGVLVVHSRTPTRFSTDDANLLESISNILSAAIDSHRAKHQRDRTLQRLIGVMEHRENVLSIISHDLRNPATTVKMNIELMRQNIRSPNPDIDSLEEALTSADRAMETMLTMMKDLLASARDDAEEDRLSPDRCDFSRLLDDVVQGHRALLQESGSKVDLDRPDSLEGTCDFVRFEQIVSNLLTNAIKYGEGEPIDISLKGDTDTVVLTVTDHGVGIDETDQRRIFGRFDQGSSSQLHDEPPDGYGLGLWIVKRIVHAMGGTIDVDSTPGAGATFTVELPRWAD